MNDQSTKRPETESRGAFASNDLLDGWTLETKWVGIGQCGAGQNRVLCRGNWGVIGGTGSFRVLHPDGWVNDTPVFKTELEAMLWVMSKSKHYMCKTCGQIGDKSECKNCGTWSAEVKPSNVDLSHSKTTKGQTNETE